MLHYGLNSYTIILLPLVKSTASFVRVLEKQETEIQMMCNETLDKIYSIIENMPRHFKYAFKILIFVFEWYGFFIHGSKFSNASQEVQINQIKSWRHSKVGLFRDFIKFFDQMIPFIILSIPKIKKRDY